MADIWLRANTRVFWLSLALVGAIAVPGVALLLGDAAIGRFTGIGLLAIASLLLVRIAYLASRPRLARSAGELLIYLRPGSPARVPLDVVEGFLLGQGESLLPGKRLSRAETTTLIIRLAERAEEWARVDVNPRLGSWCNHYVTIRGAWCEPLNVNLANDLNARLSQAKADGSMVPGEGTRFA